MKGRRPAETRSVLTVCRTPLPSYAPLENRGASVSNVDFGGGNSPVFLMPKGDKHA